MTGNTEEPRAESSSHWDLMGTALPSEPLGQPPAALALFEDWGPEDEDLDYEVCHAVLTRIGVPGDIDNPLLSRLRWIAHRWLAMARSNGHTDGCAGKQCTAARKLLNFRP